MKIITALFLIAISICAAASVALAQDDEQDVATPRPTIEEAEKLVQAISGDKVRLKAYCELSKLQDTMERPRMPTTPRQLMSF
jgi:hypothetical protein